MNFIFMEITHTVIAAIQIVLRAVERKVQQKSLVKQCYSLITAIDKEFDLTDYMTKPAQMNSKFSLNSTRAFMVILKF